MGKTALITGITGQDGSYLAEYLIKKGYKVCGIVRRSSTFNTQRIDRLIEFEADRLDWERGDLSDSDSILRVLKKVNPDEVYHLGAQSHVKVSFEMPIYSFDVDATGSLKLFEAIRTLGLNCKIYNACSSEMFGASPPPQNESTAFRPRSPYAVAKVASYYMAVNYREAYGTPIYNGILFNHESPRRGETFVTRKITRAVARIANGVAEKVTLGNLDSKRDWGYAKEFVEAMWMMLQHGTAEDFVISTGESHSVREFTEEAFKHIGIKLGWRGKGLDEKGIVSEITDTDYAKNFKVKKGEAVVELNAKFMRPTEVDGLLGDFSKAKNVLGWEPKTKFGDLVKIMVNADLGTTKLLLEGTRKNNEEWRQYLV